MASLPEPQVFWSSLQNPSGRPLLLIAASGSGPGLELQIRRAARAVGLTAHDIRPYEAIVAQSLAGRRVVAILMTVVAVGVLLLTLAGVYGAVAQAAAQRSREMAIRAVLGAAPRRLVADLMRWHVALAALGIGAGVGLGLALARIARASLVPSLNIDAAAIWVGVMAPLLTVILAGGLPALRLARGELIGRLREE